MTVKQAGAGGLGVLHYVCARASIADCPAAGNDFLTTRCWPVAVLGRLWWSWIACGSPWSLVLHLSSPAPCPSSVFDVRSFFQCVPSLALVCL